ncbi:YcnI family protein [Mycobacterium sp.]|uniref:YcnI family copper-binding membrane protein n=1 Tax=Mycobacterium sp. TaxID=1785 RepID=UPI002C8F9CFF|nr:YcnI family protein [Mycobacterium sp.]HKP42356.1 YcnI family protein [Mycobacterium sp.]
MPFISGVPARALTTVAATGAALSIALLSGAAPAWAHVRVDADNPSPGSYSVLTFKVPNESEKGALTTQLNVALPNVASASTEVMPGWTATLDRDAAAGIVRSVTWTAVPGAGIGRDQFGLFRISVKLPDNDTVSFPTTQTYADGTVVKWDQPTPPGGAEPEYPVPEVALTGTAASGDDHPMPMAQTAAPDNSARWLAGGALALSAVAVVTALVVRRRS